LARSEGTSTDAEVPQGLKEYDPEWARACYEGTISASCDHATMLSKVKCPVLFTRHAKFLAKKWGTPMGAVSDDQMEQIEKLIQATGQSFTFHEFPKMGHGLHGQDPTLCLPPLETYSIRTYDCLYDVQGHQEDSA
jgi:hypothetical protein